METEGRYNRLLAFNVQGPRGRDLLSRSRIAFDDDSKATFPEGTKEIAIQFLRSALAVEADGKPIAMSGAKQEVSAGKK